MLRRSPHRLNTKSMSCVNFDSEETEVEVHWWVGGMLVCEATGTGPQSSCPLLSLRAVGCTVVTALDIINLCLKLAMLVGPRLHHYSSTKIGCCCTEVLTPDKVAALNYLMHYHETSGDLVQCRPYARLGPERDEASHTAMRLQHYSLMKIGCCYIKQQGNMFSNACATRLVLRKIGTWWDSFSVGVGIFYLNITFLFYLSIAFLFWQQPNFNGLLHLLRKVAWYYSFWCVCLGCDTLLRIRLGRKYFVGFIW